MTRRTRISRPGRRWEGLVLSTKVGPECCRGAARPPCSDGGHHQRPNSRGPPPVEDPLRFQVRRRWTGAVATARVKWERTREAIAIDKDLRVFGPEPLDEATAGGVHGFRLRAGYEIATS